MKFGETLWQRSVPQWRNFNIDYQTLKTYTKDATTPSKNYDTSSDKGKGKAVSIPVPGNKAAPAEVPNLEDKLFAILSKEHDRVGLFVRSKWYEIGSRLGSIERQLNALQQKIAVAAGGPKSAMKLRSRFSKIETDILSVGNEIQNLSRFVAINRLAIRKLVKKHKKWTGSESLGPKVQKQLLDHPESFTKTDLDQALGRYTNFLNAVREPFSDQPAAIQDERLHPSTALTRNVSSLGLSSLVQKSDVDFDAGMALIFKNDQEPKAVYWVHQDNVVELRILLLQHMRYANFGEPDDPKASPDSPTNGKGTAAGAIILARSEAAKTDVDTDADKSQQPAAIARWTPSGNARVCMYPQKEDTSGTKGVVKLDKDRLVCRLALDSFPRRSQISRLTEEELYATSDDDKVTENVLRGYIHQNAELQAVAHLTHKRSRFVGLVNGSDQGFWACLDDDVRFARMSGNERKVNEVYKVPEQGCQSFPHAVLTLRAEGVNPALLSVLDDSHLTERVDNFSLEAHAYALCHEGAKDQSIPWLPKLKTDIRHIPSHENSPTSQSRTVSRKSSTIDKLTTSASSKQVTPNLTSRSGTSDSHGPVTPDTEVFVPPAMRAPSKKGSKVSLAAERKSQRSRRIRKRQSQPEMRLPQVQPQQQGYWNEYDNPGSEMGDNSQEFFIYVDPDAPLFPGQVTLIRWGHNVKNFFDRTFSKEPAGRDANRPEEDVASPRKISKKISQSLSVDSGSTSSDDEEEDHADADDELSHGHSLLPHPKQGLKLDLHGPEYGTFPRSRSRPRVLETVGTPPEQVWLRTSTLCFAAAFLIETAVSLLLSTSRRSLIGEVDIAVLVGVVAALSFASIGIGACSGGRRRTAQGGAPLTSALSRVPGTSLNEVDTVANGAKATVKGICFVTICIWAGILVALSVF